MCNCNHEIYIARKKFKDGQFRMTTIRNWARGHALKLWRINVITSISEGSSEFEPKIDAQVN